MNDIIYQKFLMTRICDLELDFNECLGACLKRLKNELKRHHIVLWPDFYFGNEWGCMNKKISISIPFYLATPELRELEGDVPSNEEILKILRHETGHAVNYGYKLWQQKEWKDIFGDFNKKYQDKYLSRVNPWSRSYVRHLHYLGDPHYAQKHPDEDWAETFAIWLDPRSRWRDKYKNWPNAFKKLKYVDQLMKDIARKRPINTDTKREGEYREIEETVSEWWGLDGEILDQEVQGYLKDLNKLFIKSFSKRKKILPAWKLIRRYARLLTEKVCLWISGSNRNSIRRRLHKWEAICQAESLGYLPEEENRILVELTTLLTCYVLNERNNMRS